MNERNLPTWYTELPQEVQAQITSFLQAKGREIAKLKRRADELEQKVSDRDRIIEHRNDDVTRLQSEVARLTSALQRPRATRTADELFAELLDWYGQADLMIFRIKAIGEKYVPVNSVDISAEGRAAE
jgi:uncharacterized protein (DUF3084 family)